MNRKNVININNISLIEYDNDLEFIKIEDVSDREAYIFLTKDEFGMLFSAMKILIGKL